jgi:hypothetical protein
MFVFEINDPAEGLGRVMRNLKKYGITSNSRNGPVIRFPQPVCLEYPDPRRRVLDHPLRDANHFFHLFETIWMLAGLNTVAPLDPYNSGMKQYSDDGIRFAAAYGDRWRHHFGFDQITTAVEKLRENPADRRIVIQMWDPHELQRKDGKDFACNQQILLDTRLLLAEAPEHQPRRYALDMTVTNRSNDLIYGAMGSNLFHFSVLHEYLAYHAGLQLGTYYQFSKNMHLYLENPCSKRCWEGMSEFTDSGHFPDSSLTDLGLTLSPWPLVSFVNDGVLTEGFDLDYLRKVVVPITESYKIYKSKEFPLQERLPQSLETLQSCVSEPLRVACEHWFQQRLENFRRKELTQ